MNAPHLPKSIVTVEDVQNHPDRRNIVIDGVGVKDVRHPLRFADSDGSEQAVVATTTMMVELAADKKGTHMSRFIAMLNEMDSALNLSNFADFLKEMRERLTATRGEMSTRFDFFVTKTAPVSGAKSMMNYQVALNGRVDGNEITQTIELIVPVTSLCPCSKKISEYGAHNQRSHVTLTLRPEDASQISILRLIQLVEAQASSELYAVLKREDEKYITERAYDNPKFVEDIIRDLGLAMAEHEGLAGYRVEVENFESIHNHSAYAVISHNM